MQVTPCGRVAEPKEVADLITFLASEDALYINGADVLIDGGLSCVIS
ncbi:MAG TPA: SDR family oxidoreductase [Anaerovoracaceae bacterium]|nr:SDR family oxidoreductase [Anaerovoracaceae bacterium]